MNGSVYFFRAYRDRAPRGTNLSWAHYRELSTIANVEERSWYEERAEQEGWVRDELVQAMKRDDYGEEFKGRDGKGRVKKKLKRPREATYVYKAVVKRAVDGDTLLTRIDLGFTVKKEQRLRLAQIDCDPIETEKGRKAYEYVRDQMARAPFIVLRTTQIDVYGRYVADVFYSFFEKRSGKVFSEGRYLNQELVDKGLAKLI